jgi:predicted dehydrogenase
MVLNDKQRQIGSDNFSDALKITRRQVMSGAVALPSAAALYWGYGELEGKNKKPVKAGIIGTGNQGCYAHIGQSNPDYIKFVAFSEIRPSNQERAKALFRKKYGEVPTLYEDYHEMLKQDDIELIVVALPLHLHAEATIAALNAGKHVLCEKLMAKTVKQCKEMVRAADKNKKLLAVGHQRHYSYLYANALSIIEEGLMGDIRFMRAFWHRNQTNAGAEGAKEGQFDSWKPPIPEADRKYFEKNPEALKKYGFESLEQLIRWRLDNRTGGGLLVELGSHQLDAISIFLGKHHPVAVQGVGKVSFFTDDREVWDHISLVYEYGEEANNTVANYSSICTNAFEGYGEQVMGTQGTMIVSKEQNAYLFKEGTTKDTRINWAEQRLSRPVTDSGSTMAWGTGGDVANTLTSRGYREEQEHLAWLIRNPDKMILPNKGNPRPEKKNPIAVPRCHGRVALIDGVITLASNLGMEKQKRVVFKPEWFDPYSDSVPEEEI